MEAIPNSTLFLFFSCIIGFSILCLFIAAASSIRIVPENTRLSIFRLGRYIGERGPGLVLLTPFVDRAMRERLQPSVLAERIGRDVRRAGRILERRSPSA